MQNQLTINIPEAVPVPKFHLFQSVCYCPQNGRNYQGIITGMNYTTPLEGLVERTTHGWTYEVSYLFGKSAEEAWAITQESNGGDNCVLENDLCACAQVGEI